MRSRVRLFLIGAWILPLVIALGSAQAGKEVGNHAGLSEQNVVFAFENAPAILANCLSGAMCNLNSSQRANLDTILKPLIENKPRLLFRQKSQMRTRLYAIDGQDWLVNRDLLWKDSSKSVAYSMTDATLLILKIADDYLGLRLLDSPTIEAVSTFLQQSVSERSLNLGEGALIHFVFWNERTMVAVRADSGPAFDLTPRLRSTFPECSTKAPRFFNPLLQNTRKIEDGDYVAQFLIKGKSPCEPTLREFALTMNLNLKPLGPAGAKIPLIKGIEITEL